MNSVSDPPTFPPLGVPLYSSSDVPSTQNYRITKLTFGTRRPLLAPAVNHAMLSALVDVLQTARACDSRALVTPPRRRPPQSVHPFLTTSLSLDYGQL